MESSVPLLGPELTQQVYLSTHALTQKPKKQELSDNETQKALNIPKP